MYNLEVHRPAGRSLELKTYLKKELFRITDFFEKNEAFYCYYRSKGTAMDRQYFLRGKTDHTLYHGCLSHERDPLFSTAADLKMTRILANDKLEKYIYGELARTDELTLGLAKNNYPKSKLSWTGSKSDLVELTYALIEAGVFNHGRTTLKEVSAYFENVFNVDLGGNPSRTFLELCIRKSRTAFLDKLRSVLILKMDREEKMEHKMS
nr:RteC domain-containing protein [Prevotella sp. 10(H)]